MEAVLGARQLWEASGSSPARQLSPNKLHFGPGDQALTASRRDFLMKLPSLVTYGALDPEAGTSPAAGSRAARPLQFGAARPRPFALHVSPETSAPNMATPGGSDDDGHPPQDRWNIPAVRADGADGAPAGGPRLRCAPPADPGAAAAKVGRRQAWLKFAALEGCTSVCLDAMMQGEPDPAAGFLMDGCAELKQALDLGALLLPPAGASGAPEVAIYW